MLCLVVIRYEARIGRSVRCIRDVYVPGQGAAAYFCKKLRVSNPTNWVNFFSSRQTSTNPLSPGFFFLNNSYGMHTLKNVMRLHAICALLMLRIWLSTTRSSEHWSRCTRCRRSGSSTLTFLLNNKMWPLSDRPAIERLRLFQWLSTIAFGQSIW